MLFNPFYLMTLFQNLPDYRCLFLIFSNLMIDKGHLLILRDTDPPNYIVEGDPNFAFSFEVTIFFPIQ
jgi:hypothetical protein